MAQVIQASRAIATAAVSLAALQASEQHALDALAVLDCIVRDISPLGARVELCDTSKLANIFELTFDSGRTLRACHVVWRRPMHVGVEFSPDLV